MPRINRYCYTCGIGYYYCPNCEQSHLKGYETWRVMFHEDNCRKIFDLLQKHFNGKYTDQEAKEILLTCDLSQIETFKPQVRNHIKRILETKSENIQSNNSENDSEIIDTDTNHESISSQETQTVSTNKRRKRSSKTTSNTEEPSPNV